MSDGGKDSQPTTRDEFNAVVEEVKLMAKCYIAGPMTGYPELNYPKFAEVAVRLRAMGFEVVSPAELNPLTETYANAMKKDIVALVDCDHIYLLDGWEKSKGATLEHHIASVLGIPVIELNGDGPV